MSLFLPNFLFRQAFFDRRISKTGSQESATTRFSPASMDYRLPQQNLHPSSGSLGGLNLEAHLRLSTGIGISLIALQNELIYLRLNQLQVNAMKNRDTVQFNCTIQSIQVPPLLIYWLSLLDIAFLIFLSFRVITNC